MDYMAANYGHIVHFFGKNLAILSFLLFLLEAV
jgi:hypothetical protein